MYEELLEENKHFIVSYSLYSEVKWNGFSFLVVDCTAQQPTSEENQPHGCPRLITQYIDQYRPGIKTFRKYLHQQLAIINKGKHQEIECT